MVLAVTLNSKAAAEVCAGLIAAVCGSSIECPINEAENEHRLIARSGGWSNLPRSGVLFGSAPSGPFAPDL